MINNNNKTKQIKRLIILEDSFEDYEITERAVKMASFDGEVIHFSDALQFIDYFTMHNNGSLLENSRTVVLLDLNMPKISGKDILQKLQGNNYFKSTPKIALTTSKNEKDIYNCYLYGINSYIHKVIDLKMFTESIKIVISYWFDVSLSIDWAPHNSSPDILAEDSRAGGEVVGA